MTTLLYCPMPFDLFTMAAVRDELEDAIVGARIDKVIQPSELSVGFRTWGRSGTVFLLMSADPRNARVFATADKLARGTASPSSFLMLLRKYCSGGRLEAFHQERLERVLNIQVSTHEHGTVSLMCEIMGNRSNLILVDSDRRILGALKLLGPQQNRVRPVLPHASYMLPPPQKINMAGLADGSPRFDPLCRDDALRLAFQEAIDAGHTNSQALILGLVRGASPAIARDILSLAGIEKDSGSPQAAALARAVRNLYGLLDSREWSPIVVLRDDLPVDFRAYQAPPPDSWKSAMSMSAAINEVTIGLESQDALAANRAALRTLINKRRSSIQGKIVSLRRSVEEAGDAETLREAGDMILGFQYSIEHGMTSLPVPDTDRSILLDPDLTPVANAEKYYKRYRKARDAGRRVPNLLQASERDLEFVQELESFVDLAESPADLKRIESELGERFGYGAARTPSARPRPPAVGRILTLDLSNGVRVFVGRSATQNEEITFKLAGRDDLWLHARGAPGSHVLVRGIHGLSRPADPLPDSAALRYAASMAAFYSKFRAESWADVIVARARDIRRVPGGAPGQVTVRDSQTLRVQPASIDEIRSLIESLEQHSAEG